MDGGFLVKLRRIEMFFGHKEGIIQLYLQVGVLTKILGILLGMLGIIFGSGVDVGMTDAIQRVVADKTADICVRNLQANGMR